MMRFIGDVQGWLYGGATAELKALAAGFDTTKLFVAMSIAALFGMVHAFMPGHGKTVIVSYYLGRPARYLGSVGTSAILVLTHVGSAVILVLTGFIVIRRTIGSAGRAPTFEIASATLIIAIGLWLLYRAWQAHEHVHATTDGKVLAFVTGLDAAAGLLVTAGMAVGMIATIAIFALGAVLLHDRFIGLMERTERYRHRIGRGLEIASAVAIIVFGVWLLAMR